MKKLLMLSALVISMQAIAQGPKLRVNGYAGYVFDDKVNNYYSAVDFYDATIKGSFLWGVGLEFMVQPTVGVELLYSRQDTKVPATYWLNGLKTTEFNYSVDNIMLGGTWYYKVNSDVFEPYAGLAGGVGIVNVKNPDNNNSGSATKFAWGMKLGTNIWASDRFGFKAQAAFNSLVQGYGGTYYYSTAYSSLFQFSLSGGLVIKLGGSK